jgi:hypothetical protein
MKIHYPDKQTYVDEIMRSEKKEKKPAPGQYNVMKSLKEMDAENKKLSQKKIPYQDRISYLDEVQFESSLTPGVGNYNPRVRFCLFRTESRPRPHISRQSPRNGGRSTSRYRRKSHRKAQLCGPTTLLLVISHCSRPFRSKS